MNNVNFFFAVGCISGIHSRRTHYNDCRLFPRSRYTNYRPDHRSRCRNLPPFVRSRHIACIAFFRYRHSGCTSYAHARSNAYTWPFQSLLSECTPRTHVKLLRRGIKRQTIPTTCRRGCASSVPRELDLAIIRDHTPGSTGSVLGLANAPLHSSHLNGTTSRPAIPPFTYSSLTPVSLSGGPGGLMVRAPLWACTVESTFADTQRPTHRGLSPAAETVA